PGLPAPRTRRGRRRLDRRHCRAARAAAGRALRLGARPRPVRRDEQGHPHGGRRGDRLAERGRPLPATGARAGWRGIRRRARLAPPVVLDEPLTAFRMAEGSLSMSGFERQFAEHALNAREHGNGHRLAVTANVLTSRAIVLAYRAMRALRTTRT